jgi:SAM-dependent methyltransferase
VQPLVRAFVEDVLDALQPPDPVVEFGALQVEREQDGDLRPLFAGRDFTGTDFRDGPGVDRVEDLRALTLADASVGTAICLETLEHCEDPLTACRELGRVTAPGGACLVSTPFLLGIHGFPNDYFRFTPEALRSMLGAAFDAVWTIAVGDPQSPLWVFAVAVNARPLDVSLDRLPRLRDAQRRWERAEGRVRVGPLQLTPGELWRTVRPQLARIAREKVRR